MAIIKEEIMPRPLRFAHAVLQSYDMPRLLAWYRDAFELDVLAEMPGRAAICAYDEEHHRFAFTQMPGEPPAERHKSPLKHLAYAYGNLDDLVAQYRKMKGLGHMPVECVNHGPTVSFYYEDPDGNGVEFFVDRFATMEESKAYIASEGFQKNLFGYYVDPEVIAAQLDAGTPHVEIMAYDQQAADDYMKERTAATAAAH